MVRPKNLASLALLPLVAQAQVVSYTVNGYSISVNVPADSASSGSGPLFMQISAPSGTQWISFGQGTRMAGANMFVVYARDSSNVTISPRSSSGHSMPQYNSDSQVTLLEGSGIAGDGSMIANIRCDNCLGSTMSATSTSSSWIYGYRTGSSLDTDDQSANINIHNGYSSFQIDLTTGTGGSSSNPFVQQASSPSSSSAPSASVSATSGGSSTVAPTSSQTAAGSATQSVSQPLASSNPNASSDSGAQTAGAASNNIALAHGVIMSLLFLALFPFSSLTIYLGIQNKVRHIHAPAQIVNAVLLIVGVALGIKLGMELSENTGYHQIIGYIVFVILILFQPALGVIQHLRYTRDGSKTVFGVAHRWLGRSMLVLGLINGGLGWQLAGVTSAYIPYAVIAAIIGVFYVGVVVWMTLKPGNQAGRGQGKGSPVSSSYEMSPSGE